MAQPRYSYPPDDRYSLKSAGSGSAYYDPYVAETPGYGEHNPFLSSKPAPLPYSPADASSAAISIVEGKQRRLSWSLIMPTAIVVLVTAGAATTLLLWMLVHMEQSSLGDVWSDRAFILNEGTKTEGELEAAKLLGLTISSAASSAVGITTPILMSLFAFRTARAWLAAANRGTKRDEDNLPTPLQYGLLLQLLSATGIMSLLNTGQYLARGSGKRARSTSLLKQAFSVAILVYVVTHAISAIDIWLHTTTSVLIQPTVTPVETPFQYGVDQSKCLPYPDDFETSIFPCLYGPGTWASGITSIKPGMLAAANASSELRPITLANASDLAVLVRPNIPQALSFRMTTFGARASCESVNHLCDLISANITCNGFPSTFPPASDQFTTGINQGDSKLWIQSSNCAWDNSNCSHIDASKMTDDGVSLSRNQAPTNAYSLWLQFLWESEGDIGFGEGPEGNDAVNSYSNMATMLTNCTLSFYNVTLDYSNGNYSRVEEELTNTGLSDGLAGPTRLGHYATHLLSNVQGHAFSDNSTREVMAYLEQDLARLALASAAWITNLTTPTTMQATLSNAIVGRYPFWPVAIFIALLYSHAALALFVFLATALFTRTELVRVRGERGAVSALELVQVRLTDPLAAVAARFPQQRPALSIAALSARTTAIDIFGERPGEERLRVGVHSDPVERSEVFGVWRKTSEHSKTSVSGDWDKA